MDDLIVTTPTGEFSFRSKHRFMLLIIISILVSSGLILISMALYNRSGAAQLDLSRPGYIDVRAQATTSDSDIKYYSSTGSIDQSSISEFKLLFDQQAQKVKLTDAFGSDPLSPEALGISAVSEL